MYTTDTLTLREKVRTRQFRLLETVCTIFLVITEMYGRKIVLGNSKGILVFHYGCLLKLAGKLNAFECRHNGRVHFES